MSGSKGAEVGRLVRLVLKHPREAFESRAVIDRQWRELNYTAAPDFARALDEYDRFCQLLSEAGTHIDFLPRAHGVGLDSIYVRDASVVCDAGVILCRMGKPEREAEPTAQDEALRRVQLSIAGAITPPAMLEGGDVLWLDERTLVVGRGYRTNDDGIRQLRQFVGSDVDVVVVPLPHYRGPGDVFHLMSIISPIDTDLAVVYSRLMPIPFRELLLARGISLVEVPDDEFDSMGANVLALGPRQCVMVSGNTKTRAALERAGAEVFEYEGTEISLKGGGGPTCLTRPIERRGLRA